MKIVLISLFYALNIKGHLVPKMIFNGVMNTWQILTRKASESC